MRGSRSRVRVLVLAGVLVASLASAKVLLAGQGNQIPPGVNPFAYLLGLIAGLQAQIDALSGAPACGDVGEVIVGTWSVANAAGGAPGQVTFHTDGSYTIDSGTYNAGGSWFPPTGTVTGGTYQVVAGGRAITFAYTGAPLPSGFTANRIAKVDCATPNEIVHFVLGHTHDLEILTRVP